MKVHFFADSDVGTYLGAIASDPDTTGWGVEEAGIFWFNTTTQLVKCWSGTAIVTPSNGEKGDTGATGATGAAGADGATGAQGIQGTPGPPSAPDEAPYAVRAYRSGNQAIAMAGYRTVEFNAENFDPSSVFAAYGYTCPVDGLYRVHAKVYLLGDSNIPYVAIFKNSSYTVRKRAPAYLGTDYQIDVDDVIQCSAGDVITIRVYVSSAGWYVLSGSDYSYIDVNYLGTATVPAVHYAFRATKGGNQTISTGTPTDITFLQEDFDPNANFGGTVYTAPLAGKYRIHARVQFAATTITSAILELHGFAILARCVLPGGTPLTLSIDEFINLASGEPLKIVATVAGTGTIAAIGASPPSDVDSSFSVEYAGA
jgi:hypothetical protein